MPSQLISSTGCCQPCDSEPIVVNTPGPQGAAGTNGTNGAAGSAGSNGTNGAAGTAGTNGSTTAGTNGQSGGGGGIFIITDSTPAGVTTSVSGGTIGGVSASSGNVITVLNA